MKKLNLEEMLDNAGVVMMNELIYKVDDVEEVKVPTGVYCRVSFDDKEMYISNAVLATSNDEEVIKEYMKENGYAKCEVYLNNEVDEDDETLISANEVLYKRFAI